MNLKYWINDILININFEYVTKHLKSIIPGTINVNQIRVEHISQFVLSMKRNLAQATQVTYFQYLASFLTYLKESGYIDQVPIGKGIRQNESAKNITCFDPMDLKNIPEKAKY